MYKQTGQTASITMCEDQCQEEEQEEERGENKEVEVENGEAEEVR